MKTLKNILIISLYLVIIALLGCKKDETIKKSIELTYSKAKEELPIYYNFLKYFKDSGYTFMDFHDFWQADKSNLPEKLMVIRHDVHYRDIYFAYYTYIIESNLIGDNIASYYVLLNFPLEVNESNYDKLKTDYLDIINYLKDKGVDVQPHISPVDLYITSKNPWWKNLSIDELIQIKNQNYSIEYADNIVISITGSDTLHIVNINDNLIPLITDYNAEWKTQTGLTVESYCGHGTPTAFHRSVLSNFRLLDQQCIRNAGLCSFSTDDHSILEYLDYLSDNHRPLWLENPQQIESGAYELIMHPYNWNNPQSYRDEYW